MGTGILEGPIAQGHRLLSAARTHQGRLPRVLGTSPVPAKLGMNIDTQRSPVRTSVAAWQTGPSGGATHADR